MDPGDLLRAVRRDRQLSQRELADFAERDMSDPWHGWHRTAFSDNDPNRPDWTYWRRRRVRRTDDWWSDAT